MPLAAGGLEVRMFSLGFLLGLAVGVLLTWRGIGSEHRTRRHRERLP